MKNNILILNTFISLILLFSGITVLSMQLGAPNIFVSPDDAAKFNVPGMAASTEDMVKIKILEKQLEAYNKLIEKIDGKKDEPKKGYMAVLSQEAKKMTETMIRITIWTATIPLVFVVCVTSTGAILDILARLNAFHGAGEVFWTGASGAFANIMDGITRGWFSNLLGLKNVPVVIPVDQSQLTDLSLVTQNSGFFSSWFSVKNPENATLVTPYLG